MPDGLWHADDKAVIFVGDSRIDLAEAVISPQSMLIDGISLYSRVERKCAVSAPANNQAGA